MYKIIVATLILVTSLTANASVILNSNDSFSSSFTLSSDGGKFKDTDFFWDVFANVSLLSDTSGELTLTLYEDIAGTNQVHSSSASLFFSQLNTPFSDLLGGGDNGLFADFNGSFTLENTGSSQIELFDVTISNFAGSLAPSNVATTTIVASTTVVPVPAAAWLFGSGVFALFGLSRFRGDV